MFCLCPAGQRSLFSVNIVLFLWQNLLSHASKANASNIKLDLESAKHSGTYCCLYSALFSVIIIIIIIIAL